VVRLLRIRDDAEDRLRLSGKSYQIPLLRQNCRLDAVDRFTHDIMMHEQAHDHFKPRPWPMASVC
jgi:hypothetical protein